MRSTANTQPISPFSSPTDKAVQAATRIGFLISGTVVSSWAPLVPYTKQRLHINDATLGMLVLSIGIGSLISLPLAGFLTARFSCRRVIFASGTALCVLLPLLTLPDAVLSMALVLGCLGAMLGLMDVAINVQAVEVERANQRAQMSSFHGFYSVGGIVGAGCVSLLLWLGLPPLPATLAMALLVWLMLFWSQRHMLRATSRANEGPLLAVPRGRVLFIGILCFVMFLTEGAMLDWGALYLTAFRGIDPRQAGIGFAVFSITMTLGRLYGDRLVNRLGRFAIVAGGSLCAAAGLLMTITIDNPITAIGGFALVGLGAANVVPILFSSAGNQTVMPPHLALASITTLGYAGSLLGPTLLGFVAQISSLSLALGIIVILLLAICASSHAIIRSSGD
ncbi:MFS transporter [Lonsdalea populi]|uniref:MFS transporter n=1 Tax=Lonsdalea populi TaxID=1172565 RepID=A0A3N0ULE4_9GAMM|nr:MULTISPECIES: MFS transporter [Lonsdalea]RAT17528.1 MFS transporter [Lonsdalea quercina]RAT30065.1 MFS transporter [Lonsdalea populi]RAT38007.1 MFS transporter [Lonsdalea populi]RAT48446.1 MFS transporter [Lonsdalea populi]RAT53437.1 MFS transporter [Lonsdalea populi]